MAEISESTMNFAALKRVDPYAKSLLETAAHVALYSFVNDEWDKTDTEGALFVYSRTGEPFHNILIMNRLNMKNLMEPITQGMELQLQDPFLLYRTSQGIINGIWFYDKDECVRISSIITRIIKESSVSKMDRKGKFNPVPVGKNIDIFTMLTKAQEEYNLKSPQKTRPGALGAPLDLNFNFNESAQTPQSVMDFFAKASNGSSFQDPHIAQQTGVFMSSPRTGPPPGLTRMPSLPINIPPSQNDVKPLLQRLMSNPAHSVEHIEKQQRAITPQNDLIGLLKNGNLVSSNSNGSDTRNSLNLNVKGNKPDEVGLGSTGKSNVTASVPQSLVEQNFGFLRVSGASPVTVHSQQFFNSKLAQNPSPLACDVTSDSNMSHLENHRPVSAPMETQLKPALMPPVMFTSSAKKGDKVEPISTVTSDVNANSGKNSYLVHPEPLTKHQLLQAMDYLLKNDPEFINKLHEAYVKSFAELGTVL